MSASPSPQGDGSSQVEDVVETLERRLSWGAKILIALVSIVTSIAAGAGVVYTIDNRYVHTDAYAGDLRATNARLDRSDLRTLEGQIRNVRGQIFDLERQKLGLTERELTFLKQLKEDEIRLNREIEDMRRLIQREEERGRAVR